MKNDIGEAISSNIHAVGYEYKIISVFRAFAVSDLSHVYASQQSVWNVTYNSFL